MRTHTTTTEVCTFEELSPEMQQKAIEKHYDINVGHEWWEFSYSMIEEMAQFFGIDTEQKSFCFDIDRDNFFSMDSSISFRQLRDALQSKPEDGFQAQEELFSLFGAWYKAAAKKVCPQTWKAINEGCNPYATSSSRRDYCSTDYNADSYRECDRVAADLEIFAQLCEEVLEHFCFWAKKLLRADYDDLTSDEAIRETLICNEYEFEIDGDGSIF